MRLNHLHQYNKLVLLINKSLQYNFSTQTCFATQWLLIEREVLVHHTCIHPCKHSGCTISLCHSYILSSRFFNQIQQSNIPLNSFLMIYCRESLFTFTRDVTCIHMYSPALSPLFINVGHQIHSLIVDNNNNIFNRLENLLSSCVNDATA